MSLHEISAVLCFLHFAAMRRPTRLFAKLTGGSEVWLRHGWGPVGWGGGVRGLVTFGDKEGGGPKWSKFL